MNQRKPKNRAEGQFFEEAQREGWIITKRGWPDFFCMLNGKVALIEVKPYADRELKREQYVVMRALAGYGVPCFRWSPDSGFEEIR